MECIHLGLEHWPSKLELVIGCFNHLQYGVHVILSNNNGIFSRWFLLYLLVW
jgi:hypothetical protein